jgi:hypothetical protein
MDLLPKLAGVSAFATLVAPKFADSLFGRYLSGTLERQRNKLSMQLEAFKNDLQATTAKDLEEFRNILRKENQANEVKRSDLLILLERIETALDNLTDDQGQCYDMVRRLVDKYNLRCCIEDFSGCDIFLQDLDQLIEEPGALSDPSYRRRIESMLMRFKDATRIQLQRLSYAPKGDIQ